MRGRFTGRTLACGITIGVALAGAAWAADEPANLIKYRQKFMDANSAHLGMIASVVKGEVSLTDEVAAHASALAQQGKLLTANLKQLFPEGSGKGAVEGVKSAALPVIWEKWGDFQQAAQRFAEESAKLAEVAQNGDMTAIAQQVAALGKQGCGGCHETFREKKQ